MGEDEVMRGFVGTHPMLLGVLSRDGLPEPHHCIHDSGESDDYIVVDKEDKYSQGFQESHCPVST